MQIPVGWALDKIGPRCTTAALLAVGAAGVAVFAAATSPVHITLAMVLIGIG
jgi:MFS family permease